MRRLLVLALLLTSTMTALVPTASAGTGDSGPLAPVYNAWVGVRDQVYAVGCPAIPHEELPAHPCGNPYTVEYGGVQLTIPGGFIPDSCRDSLLECILPSRDVDEIVDRMEFEDLEMMMSDG